MTNADGKFIKKVVNGENIHKAYKESYEVDTSKAKALIRDEEINRGIKEQLKAEGITLPKINKVLSRQLDAKKVVYYDPKLSKDVVDDNDAQLKAATIGYKLYGVLKEKDVIIDNRSVVFSGDVGKLAGIVKEMQELNKVDMIDTDGEVV